MHCFISHPLSICVSEELFPFDWTSSNVLLIHKGLPLDVTSSFDIQWIETLNQLNNSHCSIHHLRLTISCQWNSILLMQYSLSIWKREGSIINSEWLKILEISGKRQSCGLCIFYIITFFHLNFWEVCCFRGQYQLGFFLKIKKVRNGDRYSRVATTEHLRYWIRSVNFLNWFFDIKSCLQFSRWYDNKFTVTIMSQPAAYTANSFINRI